jgi:3-phosphoshikimate 1-carboxyvinyltransferase
MSSVTLTPHKEKFSGKIALPLSKSISNRALIISALSRGKVDPGELSDADDTNLLAELLFQSVEGKDRSLNAGNAGTVFRFLTAYLCIQQGEWILDGSERMRERPIAPLVNAMRQLGADISYLRDKGAPPLKIIGKELTGGEVNIPAGISSQFISALMMIGPSMKNGLKMVLEDDLVSFPYIRMTEKLMLAAGAKVAFTDKNIMVNGTGYGHAVLPSETDWSAAGFWYELFALTKEKSLFLDGLDDRSLQGDAAVERYFRMLGVETEFRGGGAWLRRFYWPGDTVNIDLCDQPDLAPVLIVTTAARRKAGSFTGLGSLKHKESDRLVALVTELEKAGIACTLGSDSISFKAQEMNITEPFDTYGDHRLAMAFAPLALLGKPVNIHHPEVVSKSYPNFWSELQKMLDVRF